MPHLKHEMYYSYTKRTHTHTPPFMLPDLQTVVHKLKPHDQSTKCFCMYLCDCDTEYYHRTEVIILPVLCVCCCCGGASFCSFIQANMFRLFGAACTLSECRLYSIIHGGDKKLKFNRFKYDLLIFGCLNQYLFRYIYY